MPWPRPADAARELSVWINRMAPPPPAPPMVSVDVTYLGNEAEAKALLAA
ncbi:hypothetical protein GCM10020216_104700 [Nonomuraea helvata]